MKLVWDEPKRRANLDKHGFDFAALAEDFFASALVLPGGQGRFRALGDFDDTVIAVVYAPLGAQAVSIISMRRASKQERRLFDDER